MSGTPDAETAPEPAPKAAPEAAPQAADTPDATGADPAPAGSAETAIDLERPLADQAAVLMLGDLRSYMQGSEQMLMAATAQAMKLLLDPATQATGTAALTALAAFQVSLTTFAGEVATTATTIKTDFAS